MLAVAALISCEIQWGLVDIQSAAQIYLPAGLAVCVVFAISALHAAACSGQPGALDSHRRDPGRSVSLRLFPSGRLR